VLFAFGNSTHVYPHDAAAPAVADHSTTPDTGTQNSFIWPALARQQREELAGSPDYTQCMQPQQTFVVTSAGEADITV
jgi:hypothetical protein